MGSVTPEQQLPERIENRLFMNISKLLFQFKSNDVRHFKGFFSRQNCEQQRQRNTSERAMAADQKLQHQDDFRSWTSFRAKRYVTPVFGVIQMTRVCPIIEWCGLL